MIYLSLKSLHILAAMLWVGSLCLVSFVTSRDYMSVAQIRLATRITEASIGFTWLAGIILVIMGSWYASSWWHIKVLLVIAISAIHTFVHRRWRASGTNGASTHVAVPFVVLGIAFFVVLLAVFKVPT